MTDTVFPHVSPYGHGSAYCVYCLCTDREAAFALGPECSVRREKETANANDNKGSAS